MLDKKILILLTDFFPFEAYEPYLENEFVYLEKSFNEIFIFSASAKENPLYELPAHIKYYNYPFVPNLFSKIKAVLSFNTGLLNEEKKFVNSILQKKFDLTKIKILIIAYYKAKMLKKYIKEVLHDKFKNPENLCIYSYWSDYKALTAALLKKEFPQLKAISRAHGWDVYLERNTTGYLPLRTYIFDTLDKVYFVSENGKEYTAKKYYDQSKFAVSHLGTNAPAKPVFERRRKPFHIISCSALIPLKRVELLVEAIALLPNNEEIRWTHFGKGILFNEIVKLSEKKLSVKHNIHYEFKGHVNNNEVLQFYSCHDANLFINTSSTEGLPITMMEAMSCAIPVVGTNVGGVGEIIMNGSNGFLLSPNPAPSEISERIECFINMDKDLYTQFCMNAFKTWNTKYNAAINFPDFVREILR